MPVTIGDLGGRRDQHHDLVQQVHRAPQLTEHERGLALPQHAQRPQVLVAAALRHLDDLAGERLRGHAVAVRQRGEEDRHAQVAAAAPGLVHEPLGARQPAARPGRLTAQHQEDGQPERAAHGVVGVVEPQPLAVGADPGALAVVVATGEVGR